MTSMKSLGWIGDFPASWEVMPNKALIRKKKVSVGTKADEYPLLSLTKGGVVVRNLDEGGKFPENFDSYQQVSAGDLVTCLFDVPETPRTIGLSPHNGMITGAYDVFEFTERVNPRYFEYYYLALDDRKGLSYFYSGLRNVIRAPVFLSIPMPVPPLDEQKAIADFLDRELAQIDALIEKQETLIENLQDRKQSVITRCVNRGISEENEFRHSAVDWIGEVPSSWRVGRIKHACHLMLGKMVNQQNQEGVLVPYVRAGNIQSNGLDLAETKYLPATEKELKSLQIERGDVLVVEGGAGYGRSVYLGEDLRGWIFQNHVIRLRPFPGFSGKYLDYYVKHLLSVGHFERLSNFATIPNVSADKLGNIEMPMPPLDVQIEISNHLDSIMAGMDSTLKKSFDFVTILQERRQSLISAAVTGKIDVRKVA